MDMHDAIEEFIADLRLAGRADWTITKHTQELRRLADWLDQLDQLDRWQQLDRRELSGYVRGRAHLGASGRANMLCTMRVFFRWAVEVGYVAMSPAAGFRTPRKPQPLPRALTVEQVKAMICHLKAGAGRRARRDEAVLLTALYAGLRACELSALRWRQIDQVAGAINVEISKGHKGRAVPLHPSLARVLADWRITQELEGDSAPVFSLDGAPICPNRIGKIARRVAQSTGLPLTAHVLRHTFATSGLRGSGNIYAVSKALGHAQLKQTEIYIAASTRDSMPAVAALPDIDSW